MRYLDWRWFERLQALLAYPSRWWLTASGLLTREERRQWNRLVTSVDGRAKAYMETLMQVSRERALEAAWEENCPPVLAYPALNVEEVAAHLTGLRQLDAEIAQVEPDPRICALYHAKIEEASTELHLIQAVAAKENARFWDATCRLYPMPTKDECLISASYVKYFLVRGLAHIRTREQAASLWDLLCTRLTLPFGQIDDDEEREAQMSLAKSSVSQQQEHLWPAQAIQQFFARVLREAGFHDWQVIISPNATNAWVDQETLVLPKKTYNTETIRHLLFHELGGHAMRKAAGKQSALRLLSLGTAQNATTEEGYLLYCEQRLAQGKRYNMSGIKLAIFALGLASGAISTPAFSFRELWSFLTSFSVCVRWLKHPNDDAGDVQHQARSYAKNLCLRIFRGVPDLSSPGVCNTKDIIYLRGLRQVERAVAENPQIIDDLAVGSVGLELLPMIHTLGIRTEKSPLSTFQQLALDPHLEALLQKHVEIREPWWNERRS